MKQLYKHLRVFFLSLLFGGAIANAAQAQTKNSPTIDGVVSYSSPTATEYGSKGENWVESGVLASGGTRWFLTFDDTYLYIGVEGVNSAVPAVLYFNTSTEAGLTSGVEGSSVKLPFEADVAIIVGSSAASSQVQVVDKQRGDLTWREASVPAPTSSDIVSKGNTREMRVAWKSFNTQMRPPTFEWLAYLRNTINNPAPVVNTSGTDYTYYYNVYTPSNAPTFERLSYTASATTNTLPGGTFFNYAVNAGKKEVKLTSDLTVGGRLYVRNTTVNTGSNTITLDQYATLDEEENDQVNRNNNGYILGKVAMQTTLDKDGVYSFGDIGLKLAVKALSPSQTYPGNTLITRLTGQTYTGSTGRTTISRFFFVSPSTTASSNLDVEISLHYAQEEKNSIPEGRLSFFRSTLPATITLSGAAFAEEGSDRTGSNAGSNTVVLGKVRGAKLQGLWTLAAQGVPLPVELTQFTAQAETNAVRLRWATASELNNKGFEVQRQMPAGTWQTLTFINGHGTSDRSSSYEYLDRTAGAGIQYYRLVQTDLDGKITYSAVVTVAVGTQAAGLFTLYPSPATTSLSLSGLQNGKHSVAIYNTQGQRVASHELSEAQTTVAIDHLPAGIYTLRVVGTGRASASARFVKE
ncbi:T9SS type A sorting domain-containing protein [Hymenobacter fodinae]|uniref:T9SS type A sorting domain-containing protein n=1 Tax=Hymenobacter fodinae TaxID=2510796 RepID=A0A4Z0P7Z3_9BACT|nr:T9SS type A sorting domain-containing protein [Hymenobacter fodinae]TGE08078.1 T9SS type A sorting domain-containing protein [Hymenobacter fodinae]